MKKTERQEIESTRRPPTTGPRIAAAAEAPAQIPKARPCSSPSKLAVSSASEPGTSSAPAAPCRTRKKTSSSMLGARPQRSEVTPKLKSPTANMRRRPK